MRIIITNEQNFVPVDEKKIREALKLVPGADKKFRLSVVYLDNGEITKLNLRYLQKDEPTDVLAFPMESDYGEVIVSGEMALNEAQERGIEPEGELLLYTIHGTLHLMGYDDHTEEDASQMHGIERGIITQLGYTWSWD